MCKRPHETKLAGHKRHNRADGDKKKYFILFTLRLYNIVCQMCVITTEKVSGQPAAARKTQTHVFIPSLPLLRLLLVFDHVTV